MDGAGDAHLVVVFLEQREDADLDRGHARHEAQHGADVLLALVVGEDFLVEGLADEGQHGAVAAGGRLDDVGQEALLGFLIEVDQGFTGAFFMHAQVVVGAVGHAFQLLDAEGKLVFDVVGPF